MSETTPPKSVRDQIIADATSLPDLIRKASVMDPSLAAALTEQANVASKTPLGALLGAGLAWLVAHYGIGWGQETDDLVAGAGVLIAGYVTHYLQAKAPVLTPAPVPAAAQ